jgi:hypothetical protein
VEPPRPVCALRVGRGPAVAGSVEDPECPGPLFQGPRGAGFSSEASGACCAVSVEEAVRPGGLAPGTCHPRAGFDEPSSLPLPARVGEPDRAGAFAEEPREAPTPAFASLLPRGAFASCLAPGRLLPDAFCAELCSAGVFSSSCAGACGATKTKSNKIQINRAANAKLLRADFMTSPLGFSSPAENFISTAGIRFGLLRLSSAELRRFASLQSGHQAKTLNSWGLRSKKKPNPQKCRLIGIPADEESQNKAIGRACREESLDQKQESGLMKNESRELALDCVENSARRTRRPPPLGPKFVAKKGSHVSVIKRQQRDSALPEN